MPVLKIESEKVKTIRENNYAGHLWKESEMRPRIFLGDVFPHRVYDYADTQYLVDIIIGKPSVQKFRNFMDGSVAGFFGNDTVQLGSSYYGDGELVVPGAIFGQAVKVPKSFASHPAEGVVGMGFQSLAVGSFTPPLLRAIHLGLLDQQVFTVFLRRAEGGRDGVDGGLVTYGGVDSKNCDSVIVYEPLTEPAYWQFKVYANVCYIIRLSAVSSGNFTSEDGWSVISDTSSALIVAPLTIAVRLASIFGAEEDRIRLKEMWKNVCTNSHEQHTNKEKTP
ncbi:eukaryotic aspartyl protease [Ancylostoma ceylanicum]|uniref:Eukaryotic aspartyl protease n=1 Tax=Ancylostoma ceylanicum TaxID=53326 RepID=A0A0D6LPS5_9BILA|nr:eukaryotic aspartyl protease [Ancylostoma ceylanicum]